MSNEIKTIADFADEYALEFIVDCTKFSIDGKEHKTLVVKFMNFYCAILKENKK